MFRFELVGACSVKPDRHNNRQKVYYFYPLMSENTEFQRRKNKSKLYTFEYKAAGKLPSTVIIRPLTAIKGKSFYSITPGKSLPSHRWRQICILVLRHAEWRNARCRILLLMPANNENEESHLQLGGHETRKCAFWINSCAFSQIFSFWIWRKTNRRK